MFSRRKVMMLGAISLLGLGAPFSGRAHAQYSICRTDPKVFLSNGMEVDLSAGQGGAVGQVTMITYTLHVPAGVTVTKFTYTGGTYANKESLSVVSDDLANTYDETTVVSSPDASMTAATQMSLKTTGKTSQVVQGLVNQPLSVELTN